MHDPATRDAVVLRQSLSGDFVNLEAATEVICSRTLTQIQTIKQIYHSMYGAYVEHDVAIQASGDHEKLLLACLTTQRYEGFEVDRAMVEKDAKALYKAGEKKLGTDEKTFIHIFSERSRAHLAAVDHQYQSVYGSLKKAVKSETSGKFELALLTILQCSTNPAKYFAKLCKPVIAFSTSDKAHKLPSLKYRNILLDSAEFDSMMASPTENFNRVDVYQSEAAAIMYSSGTTGKVKGVVLTHRNFISMLAVASSVHPVRSLPANKWGPR